MNKIVKSLLLLACLLVMLGSAAMAEEVTSAQAFAAAFRGTDATVTLGSNLTISETVTIDRAVTLDLGSYALTSAVNGPLFRVVNGGNLTITADDASVTYANVKTLGQLTSAPSYSDYGKQASYSGSKLTWYETHSRVNADGISTTETIRRYEASSMGRIVAGNNGQPAIVVTGENADLNMQGGAIYGFTNSAIQVYDRATFNMEGGYLLGNTADRGGAVYGEGAYLNISGGVMSGNGALGYGTSSNKDENHNYYGGGAVYLCTYYDYNDWNEWDGTPSIGQMTGGMLTNNYATSNRYYDGGGAVLVETHKTENWRKNGSSFEMDGGYVTGNIANNGGGLRTGWQKSNSRLIINNGTIASNVAREGEGGGVAVNAYGYGHIMVDPYSNTAATDKIYITNNAVNSDEHWGGGGVFCANDAWMVMEATLITQNHADGFGGGVTGCPTGRIDTVALDIANRGAAIFGNTADGQNLSGAGSTKGEDHTYEDLIREGGYQDYFSALSSNISGTMLGDNHVGESGYEDYTEPGGSVNWTGVLDSVKLQHAIGNGESQYSGHIASLVAHPSKSDQADAIKHATTFVTGNYSHTHGAGILCDGYLVFQANNSREVKLGDRFGMSGTKALIDANGNKLAQTAEQFVFHTYEAEKNGNRYTIKSTHPVAVGTNSAASAGNDSSISFDTRITMNQEGTFYFVIKEVGGSNATIRESDGTEGSMYGLRVDVAKQESDVQNGPFKVVFYRISQMWREILDENGNVVKSHNWDPWSGDNGAVWIGDVNFTNQQIEEQKIKVSVTKVWENTDNPPSSITVELLADNAPYKTATLSAANGWTYTWTDLPADQAYSVKEIALQGYVGKTETRFDGDTLYITLTNQKVQDVKVVKEWHGTSNPPASVTVNLLADGVKVGEATLSAANGWAYTWTNLAADKTYTIEESVISGYTGESTTRYDADSNTLYITLTNTKNAVTKAELKVNKVWVGGTDRPAITVNLKADGTTVDSVVLSEANNWMHTFTELDAQKTYTVEEVKVEGYTPSYSQPERISTTDDESVTTITTSITITNTKEKVETAELKVSKIWVGGTDRPAITVHLSTGGVNVDSVVLSEANNWMHTFTGLDAKKTYTVVEDVPDGYASSYSEPVTTSVTVDHVTTHTTSITITNTKEKVETAELKVSKIWEGGTDRPAITVHLSTGGVNVDSVVLSEANNWMHTFTGLDAKKTYTVVEDVPDGYAPSYSKPVTTSVTVGDVTTHTTSITITNTKAEEKKQNVVVTKKWLGGDTHPESITVELYNGSALVDTVKLSEQNSWTYTWTGLPQSEGYRVVEIGVNGYTGTCDVYSSTVDGVVTKTFVLTNVKDELLEEIENMPETGDYSSVGFWMAAMAAAGAGIAMINRRKKED